MIRLITIIVTLSVSFTLQVRAEEKKASICNLEAQQILVEKKMFGNIDQSILDNDLIQFLSSKGDVIGLRTDIMVLTGYKVAVEEMQNTKTCTAEDYSILNFGMLGIPSPEIRVDQLEARVDALSAYINCLVKQK